MESLLQDFGPQSLKKAKQNPKSSNEIKIKVSLPFACFDPNILALL